MMKIFNINFSDADADADADLYELNYFANNFSIKMRNFCN